MSYTVIPVQAEPNQVCTAILDGQQAQITLQTTDVGLFISTIYNGTPVETGRICQDRVDLNPDKYRGLPQVLSFVDLQGTTDPVYTGFNTRYLLIYGTPPTDAGGVIIPPSTMSTGLLDSTFVVDHTILG